LLIDHVVDRRRSPRYVFFAPVDAQAHAVYEAVVESWSGNRAVVMTTHAATRGDDVMIRCRSLTKELTTCAARVLSSTPVAGDDGTMPFRLMLSVAERAPVWRSDLVPGP
jgi:hypothetical protein